MDGRETPDPVKQAGAQVKSLASSPMVSNAILGTIKAKGVSNQVKELDRMVEQLQRKGVADRDFLRIWTKLLRHNKALEKKVMKDSTKYAKEQEMLKLQNELLEEMIREYAREKGLPVEQTNEIVNRALDGVSPKELTTGFKVKEIRSEQIAEVDEGLKRLKERPDFKKADKALDKALLAGDQNKATQAFEKIVNISKEEFKGNRDSVVKALTEITKEKAANPQLKAVAHIADKAIGNLR